MQTSHSALGHVFAAGRPIDQGTHVRLPCVGKYTSQAGRECAADFVLHISPPLWRSACAHATSRGLAIGKGTPLEFTAPPPQARSVTRELAEVIYQPITLSLPLTAQEAKAQKAELASAESAQGASN